MRLNLILSAVSEPYWRFAISRRVRLGAEDPARVRERFGHATEARPSGEVLWFHAQNCDECISLMTMLGRLSQELPNAHFLLTTSEQSPVSELDNLAPRVIHQYLPVDAPGPVRRFLDHWRPSVAVNSELNLKPRLILATAKREIPQAFINGSISKEQAKSLRRSRKGIQELLATFQHVLVQNDASYDRIVQLGAEPERSMVVGSLKGAADPLPDQTSERLDIVSNLGARPRWLAASVDQREEEALLRAHEIARESEPGLILFLVPDNPNDADQSSERARNKFTGVAQRSKGEKVKRETAVYIADTNGEMGLWYRLCPVSFVGNSMLVDGNTLSGKNPLEAAGLDSLIVHGPCVRLFRENYAQLKSASATVLVKSESELAKTVLRAQDPAWRIPYIGGARKVLLDGRRALDSTIEIVLETRRSN